MITRCKMTCNFIRKNETGETTEVSMSPVVDGSEENKKFFKYTPGGRLDFYTLNPDVKFEMGKAYFVDITLAE
jgi:hypothetical protein